MKEAVKMIVDGRVFDRGIICSGEQTIITPADRYEEMRKELEAYGGYWIEKDEDREKLLKTLFPEGKTNKDMVGQDVQTIAKAAGVAIPEGTEVIVMPEEASVKNSLLRKEKMFPVITPFKYEKFSEAVDSPSRTWRLREKAIPYRSIPTMTSTSRNSVSGHR